MKQFQQLFPFVTWGIIFFLVSQASLHSVDAINGFVGLSLLLCGVAWYFEKRRKKPLSLDFFDSATSPTLLQWIRAYFFYLANFWSEFFIKLLICASLRSFVIDIQFIPSASMQPNFYEGDRVLVQRNAFGWTWPWKSGCLFRPKEPKRGEIVCFYPPKSVWSNKDKFFFVKRIIGLPGDTIHWNPLTLEVIPAHQDPHLETSNMRAVWSVLSKQEQKTLGAVSSKEVTLLKENLLGLSYPVQFVPVNYLSQIQKKMQTCVVPEGHYFCLGDNRNNSQDSRFFGPVPRENIVSKPLLILYNTAQGGSNWIPCFRLKRFFKKIG